MYNTNVFDDSSIFVFSLFDRIALGNFVQYKCTEHTSSMGLFSRYPSPSGSFVQLDPGDVALNEVFAPSPALPPP